jgi:hypothetical protein
MPLSVVLIGFEANKKAANMAHPSDDIYLKLQFLLFSSKET